MNRTSFTKGDAEQTTGHQRKAPTDPPAQAGTETADAAAATDLYARRFSGRSGKWMLGVQTALLLGLLVEFRENSVLDVGGGHAQVTPVLWDEGFRVHTIVSGAASTDRLVRKGVPQQSILVGDLMDLPFADRSFDTVVSFRMMAHVRDMSGFVTELCRVANRTVVVDYTCSQGVGRVGTWFFRMKRFLEGDTRPYAVSTRSEIVELFERNGFMMDQHVGQFALPLVLHRKLRSARLSGALEFLLRPLARRYGNPVILRATRRDDTA